MCPGSLSRSVECCGGLNILDFQRDIIQCTLEKENSLSRFSGGSCAFKYNFIFASLPEFRLFLHCT